MSANPKDTRDALRRLADSMAEDILNASDEDILEGAGEAHGDPDKIAADMRKLFDKTESEAGKAKLTAARAAAAAYRRRPPSPARMDPAEIRRRYCAIVANDPDARRTLAARHGEEPSDDDMRSALEDFEELGVVPPDDSDGTKK
jgi:hypothetical protein